MLKSKSPSLVKHAVTKRSLASINTGTVRPAAPKSHPFRRFLVRSSVAISLFYAGGVALSQYNDDFGDLFVENVPFAETLVDSFESYRDATMSFHPLTLEELRNKFGGMLGGKVSSVPNEGVKAQDADESGLKATVPASIENKDVGSANSTAKNDAVLVYLNPISVALDSDLAASSKFGDLVKELNDTIKVINDQKIAVAKEQLSDITEAHQRLTVSVLEFNKDFDAAVREGVSAKTAEALKELTDKYERKLRDDETQLISKFRREFNNYKVELEERSSKQLAEDLKTNEQTLLAKHANEVALLSITQVEEFNKILKEKLDEERNGRLSHLKDLDTGVGKLLESVEKLNRILMKKEAVTQLTLTLEELRGKLQSSEPHALNIEPQLKQLKSLSDILPDKPKPCCKSKGLSPPLIDVAIAELDNLTAGTQILTNEQLYNRWNLLAADFKTASLLPPNAGILGHTFAKLCSFFLFTKEGSSPTNQDLDSVFSRVNENLRLSKLDKAVEEAVALQGWPHVLCQDWIKDARRKLEVEALVDVLDCELRTL
ncbi:hypothetical protein HG536_0F01700 [Torulaspora globosa]|uniref:MICOS complex subunit MIC60 n=1 Tax=Torulaspora globosa TaxID=48254 RepID=A0A7G3ZK09_9SACH|nr:uncharacterized protein HG536_0F01700 [Torulaspora globosa]QLL33845.1 hypothetical protein HG536_0F01700 [Torulaspora globosa]